MENKQDIEKFESRSPEILPAETQEQSPFEILAKMASDPNVNVEKMERFIDLQKRIWDYQAEHEYNKDMVLCQEEMPVVPKDADNKQTNSKYPKLETIIKYTKPIYVKHGFAVEFYEGKPENENDVRIMADIKHRGGHTVTRYIDIPMDDKGPKGTVNKTRPHAKVSSITYGRSRLLRMIFNIPDAESDDDGNAAGSELIDDKQLSQIVDMVNGSGADLNKFLNYLRVPQLEAIPKSKFKVAITALESKLKQKEKAK